MHPRAARLPRHQCDPQHPRRRLPGIGGSASGPKGRVTASTTYQIHDLPPDQTPISSTFSAIGGSENNYRVIDDSRHGTTDMYLWVENNQDGFTMAYNPTITASYLLLQTRPADGRTATRNHLPDGPIDLAELTATRA
jgi:hypothetical protein